MRLGTRITNPTRNPGQSGFIQCQHCKKYYTQFGVTRHVVQCKMNPRRRSLKPMQNQPKIYYVEDPHRDAYRVGRSDWPGDSFNIIPRKDFLVFRRIYEGLGMELVDRTYTDD